MNGIIWQPRAHKQLKKLGNQQVQKRILAAVAGLSNFPAVSGVKPLNNHQYGYRLRVGNYRVLFDVYTAIEVISIEEVKKRDERTY